VDRAKGLLPERVWQESVLCSSKESGEQKDSDTDKENQKTTSNNSGSGNPEVQGQVDLPENSTKETAGQWDFTDPTKKSLCSCTPK